MKLHWSRIGVLAGAAIALVGTALPWLTGVPEHVLSIGSGTILGITTVHGMIAAASLIGIGLIAALGARDQRPTRGGLVGVLALALVALGVASLVLGTSEVEIFDAVESAAPDGEAGELAVTALAKQLESFRVGSGGLVFAAGIAVSALVAISAMFVKRRA